MKAALKLAGPALVVAGAALLYFAYQAHQSAQGQLTEFFSGSPSDRALQFGLGGAICLVLGLGGSGKAFLGKAK